MKCERSCLKRTPTWHSRGLIAAHLFRDGDRRFVAAAITTSAIITSSTDRCATIDRCHIYASTGTIAPPSLPPPPPHHRRDHCRCLHRHRHRYHNLVYMSRRRRYRHRAAIAASLQPAPQPLASSKIATCSWMLCFCVHGHE